MVYTISAHTINSYLMKTMKAQTQKIQTHSNEGAYLQSITKGCVNWCNIFFVILLWFHCHLIAILLSFLVSILVEYFLDTYSCIYSFILSTNIYWALTMCKVCNLCYRDPKMNMSQPLSSIYCSIKIMLSAREFREDVVTYVWSQRLSVVGTSGPPIRQCWKKRKVLVRNQPL